MGEVQLIILIEVVDVSLDGLLRLVHIAFDAKTLRILCISFGHSLKLLHSDLESSLSFLLVPSPVLPLLELGVDLISFMSLKEQKFLVDQHGIETGPT